MAVSAYDDIAAWYDEYTGAGSLLDDPFFPAVQSLLGEIAGLRLCDLACGQGRVPAISPSATRGSSGSTSPASCSPSLAATSGPRRAAWRISRMTRTSSAPSGTRPSMASSATWR